MMQCSNCGSWDTEYEYLYVNNIPIHLAFSCNNCNERYGKELVGDEKGYSIKLKEKDSEWIATNIENTFYDSTIWIKQIRYKSNTN